MWVFWEKCKVKYIVGKEIQSLYELQQGTGNKEALYILISNLEKWFLERGKEKDTKEELFE